MQKGKVFIGDQDLADIINSKIEAKSTNISSGNATYGTTSTSGSSFTIPVITVSKNRVTSIANKTVSLYKSHCSYCTYCSYDNQCSVNS